MSNALPYESQINPVNQWGYVFGWSGKVATSGKWAGRWAMDCNGLFEFFLRLELGGNHDTYSRYNYRDWCKGYNGSDMNKMPQIPGTAVFVYGPFNTSAIVHHVGVLWRKIGPGPRDWLVIEAANSTKGVIVSKMGSGWNRWGLMKLKFEYDTEPAPPPIKPKTYTVEKGDSWIRIAKEHGTTYDKLLAANGHNRLNKPGLHPGMVLKLP
jgi:hypothetical protein